MSQQESEHSQHSQHSEQEGHSNEEENFAVIEPLKEGLPFRVKYLIIAGVKTLDFCLMMNPSNPTIRAVHFYSFNGIKCVDFWEQELFEETTVYIVGQEQHVRLKKVLYSQT